MEVHDESRELLVIATHLGYFRYTRLPFGVSVAPALFQNFMDTILCDLHHVSCFLDDIIITGKDDTEHLSNLDIVLSRLENIGLTTQKSKCKFYQESITYLGHKIDKNGIHPDKSSVECLLDMPAPSNTKELKSWLGSVNFYSRFIPMLQPISSELYSLLRKDTIWNWSIINQNSFDKVLEKLVSCNWLAHYDPNLPIIMDTDASSQGNGAVLIQLDKDGHEHPISFTSRILSTCEQKYSTIEREALAIVYGLRKFNHYLFGRSFKIRTDHKPLEHLFSIKRPLPAIVISRLERWLLILNSYDFKIIYRSGASNAIADSLSRLPRNHQESPEEIEEQAENIKILTVHLEGKTTSKNILKKNTLSDPTSNKDGRIKDTFKDNTDLISK
ncbi:Transposon Tf2-8 polyprotein [Thelohanellus kitauei]|uniref:Transposon Tf2-8 polyprotein n=1 Tax=Thelohanellus kitauei TaxID=669202 RepID=A0A0C2NF64_THEKT|nr:Transposon Tf2-8 polyprotein [Thelohanellus kitauei]